jgi:hypothetical protein
MAWNEKESDMSDTPDDEPTGDEGVDPWPQNPTGPVEDQPDDPDGE